MSARWRWVAMAAVLVLAAGLASAYVGLSRHTPQTAKTPPAAVRRTPALLPLPPGAEPSSAGVRSRLARFVANRAFGGSLGAVVVDAATGRELLVRHADDPMPPASTAKLLTAVAALETLGPAETLSTGVVRAGSTLFLVGGGDVTLTRGLPTGYPRGATLSTLAAQTAAALTTAKRVRLCVDTTAWHGPAAAPGWNAGYFRDGDIAPLSPLAVDEGQVRLRHRDRVRDPAMQAAAVFGSLLHGHGITVTGRVCRGAAPASGLGLAAVDSPPVPALVQRMLTDSDNDLAEALGRAVATRAGRHADFAGEGAAIVAAVRGLGLDASRLRLYDASGLSRLDRVTARTLVQLVELAASSDHPELRPVIEGLPVGAFTGTLADRYRRGEAAAAAGIARAKTGTLAGVNSLAGVLVDRGGRRLVFALLTARAVGPHQTEAALDDIVGRLATCGCG